MKTNRTKLFATFVGKFLLFTSGWMLCSSFIYLLMGRDMWFSRLFLSVVSLGFAILIKK